MIFFNTKRLLIRNFTAKDLTDLFDIMKEPEITSLGGWKNLTDLSESKSLLEQYIQDNNIFAIQLKTDQKVIGFIKLTVNNNKGNCIAKSVSYILVEKHWGNGYMTEALNQIIKYAFESLNVDILTAFHYPQNIRSKKVLEKCGFEYEGTIENSSTRFDGKSFDAVCYLVTKDDYFRTV